MPGTRPGRSCAGTGSHRAQRRRHRHLVIRSSLSMPAREEALQMDRVVRFLRIVAVLAIPAAILFVTTGNHVHGL
jgi:hypothetical protein